MCYTAERDEDPDHDHTNSIRTPSCQVWWDNNDCIAILHFARQLGLKDLAPIALFQCAAHISSTDILFAAASNENMDRIHTLSFAELQECIKVREFLVEQKLKFFKIFSDIQQSPRTCRQPFDVEKESCFATLAYLTATAHSSRSMTSLMAMRPMDEWLWRHSGDENSPGRDNLCNACAPRVFTAFSELQKGIWYDICVMSGWNLAEVSPRNKHVSIVIAEYARKSRTVIFRVVVPRAIVEETATVRIWRSHSIACCLIYVSYSAIVSGSKNTYRSSVFEANARSLSHP